MNKTELLALAERVEQADGPNYALEQDIAEAVWRVKWNKARPKDIRVPNYTASIDAALTLVPESMVWHLDSAGPNYNAGAAIGTVPASDELMVEAFQAEAKTPALALTAAALRAIAGGADE